MPRKTSAERRLQKMFDKWVPLLGLDHWELTCELAPDEKLNNDGWAPGFETAAEASVHWEYMRGVIRFSEPWVDKASDLEIEDTVIHELQHVMLNELRRVHRMHNEERTAVMLTRAFLRVQAKGAV